MKKTTGETIFYGINYVVLGLLGLSCVLPLVHIVAISFSSPGAVLSGFVGLWPVEFTVVPYISLMQGTNAIPAFGNSVVITVVGVTLSMLFTILAAYPLSRSYFYARKWITLAILFTMLFSGGLIPSYLLLKSLNVLNTYWAVWLPGLVSAYNMLILRTFFQQIPDEVDDAARIDGCGELRLLIRIVLPLSVPVLATLILFYGVAYWNTFMSVLIFIPDASKHNLTVMIQQMIQNQQLMTELQFGEPELYEQTTQETVKAAGIVLLIVPMLVIYPFLQKYFVKGVMIGSIKG